MAAQVLQLKHDVRPAQLFQGRQHLRTGQGHPGQRRARMGQPARQRGVGIPVEVVGQQRLHGTASRVPAHHDRGHPQDVDGVVQGGGHRQVGVAPTGDRDDVADIADGEQVAGSTAGDDVRDDPGVDAGEEQRAGTLTVRELPEGAAQQRSGPAVELGDPHQHRAGGIRAVRVAVGGRQLLPLRPGGEPAGQVRNDGTAPLGLILT